MIKKNILRRFFSIDNCLIHPLLLSVFPTIALYAYNINESWLSVTVIPILYSLFFALFCWLFFHLLLRNAKKTSLITSIWILLFFSYGHIYLFITGNNLIKLIPISPNKILLTIYFFIILISFFILFRIKRIPDITTRFFNIIGIVLIFINIVNIIPFEFKRIIALQKLLEYRNKNKLKLTAINKDINSYPDIYYFVFDRYGNDHILKKYLNYDNKQFFSFKKEKNFYIADKSFANYPATFLSLSSSLNMEYLNYLNNVFGKDYTDQAVVYSTLIEDNNVVKFLKNIGYRYIQVGSRWAGTKVNKLADENYNKFIDFNQFELYLYENTLSNTVLGKLFSNQIYSGALNLSKIPENLYYRMDKIKEIIPSKGPKFIFGHFLLPHRPFLVSADCRPLDLDVVRKRSNEEGYIDQLKCANKEIKILIEEIQKKPKRPTVIIIQSDEGPFLPEIYFNKEAFPKVNNKDSYDIHTYILNSYYLTDKKNKVVDYKKLNFNRLITPVNTFRLIFNYYFDTKLKILENRSFIFKERKYPYDFIEITNKIKN